jgi:hypothetical protein
MEDIRFFDHANIIGFNGSNLIGQAKICGRYLSGFRRFAFVFLDGGDLQQLGEVMLSLQKVIPVLCLGGPRNVLDNVSFKKT